MGNIIQGNARLSHHTLTTPGLSFSVPLQEDFTLRGSTMSWDETSLALSEIGVNEGDKKAYIRIADTINELAFVGGINGNTLEQTLHYGNESGTYSIIMGTATSIKSANGGGQIDLDYFSSPNEVSITTDNGNQVESYLYMTSNSTDLVGGDGGSIGLAGDVSINAPSTNRVYTRVGNTGFVVDGRYNAGGSEDIIKFINNATQSFTTSNNNKPSISIASRNSTINSGVTNSVIIGGASNNVTANNTVVLGGSSISGSQSNMVYVPSLYVNSGSVYNTSLITNGSALGYSSYMLIDTLNSGIYVNSNNGFVISGTGTNNYIYSRWFHNTESATNSTAATTTIKSLLPPVNMNFTIEAIITAYSSNKAYSAKLFAVFRNDSGTVTQVGTTDVTAKDDFSDGTAATIDTDGTNVRIRITNGSGLSTQWTTRYSYNS